jgi:hypothetical protein
MRRGFPLLPLALVALNVTVIHSGDSFRGYGLGCAFNVLSLALIWQVAQKPTLVNALLGALGAVLSVQCLYQNAFFVLAACCGGIAACAVGRRWRDTLWLLGIGLAAAASLVPYVRIIVHSQEWYVLEKVGFHFSDGWRILSTALGSPLPVFNWVWAILCFCAIGIALLSALPRAGESSKSAPPDLIVFGITALLVGMAGFAVFLKSAGLPTQSWYYMPLMAFVAACLDAILPECCQWARPVIPGFAVLTTIAVLLFGLPAVKCRQTNVDLIAARLAKEATTGDYVIVDPWYCGVSFDRYYKGAAPWTTLPPLEDHTLHRYDLVKIEMQRENPIQPVLDKVAVTLQSGNRVWLVGWMALNSKRPPDWHPAPNNPWGWLDDVYSQIWSAQASYFITTHASQGKVIIGISQNCNPFENLSLILVTGWRSASPSATKANMPTAAPSPSAP